MAAAAGPPWALVQKAIGYFNVIWDEAEELQRLAEQSDPRIVIDTAGLSPAATRLVNLLSHNIRRIDEATIHALLALVQAKEKTECLSDSGASPRP